MIILKETEAMMTRRNFLRRSMAALATPALTSVGGRALMAGAAGLTAAGTSTTAAAAAAAGDFSPYEIYGRLKVQVSTWALNDFDKFHSSTLWAHDETNWKDLVQYYFAFAAESPPSDYAASICTTINAANLCPSFKYADDISKTVMENLDYDISFSSRHELAEFGVTDTATAVATWLSIDIANDEDLPADYFLALIRNTTEGNNNITNGFQFDPFVDLVNQENVVLWDMNHPTNFDSWKYRAVSKGWPQFNPAGADGPVRWVKTVPGKSTTDSRTIPMNPTNILEQIIYPFLNLIDSNTRLLSVSWQSNECGMVLPVELLCLEVKRWYPNCMIHLDGAQAFGVLPVDIHSLELAGLDSFAGSFHKWPCGPKMVGVQWMSERMASNVLPNIWGYDEWIKTPTYYGYPADGGTMPDESRRFSFIGQQNDATLAAACVTAQFHNGYFHPNVNSGVISDRTSYLGTYTLGAFGWLLTLLHNSFDTMGWDDPDLIWTPRVLSDIRSSVCIFQVPLDSSDTPLINVNDVVSKVYDEYGYAIASPDGEKTLRVAPAFFNNPDEILINNYPPYTGVVGAMFYVMTDLCKEAGYPEQVACTLHQRPLFLGYSIPLPVGTFTLSELRERGMLDNDISSVRLTAGFGVTLYEHDDFQGATHSSNSHIPRLRQVGFNNRLSSIVVHSTQESTITTI